MFGHPVGALVDRRQLTTGSQGSSLLLWNAAGDYCLLFRFEGAVPSSASALRPPPGGIRTRRTRTGRTLRTAEQARASKFLN